mmetsp:Transcript_56190/g.100758  ORF Transcript_56190/g.100758 Transcript_56190/m.100758 type:complete len:251 (-) Transcript_56190:4007-4759(-)
MAQAIVGAVVCPKSPCGGKRPGSSWMAASASGLCAFLGRSCSEANARLVLLADSSMRAVSALTVPLELIQIRFAVYLARAVKQEDLPERLDTQRADFALLDERVKQARLIAAIAIEGHILASQACPSACNVSTGRTARMRGPGTAKLAHRAPSACGEATIAPSVLWANINRALGCLYVSTVPWGPYVTLQKQCSPPQQKAGGDCAIRWVPMISGYHVQARTCAKLTRHAERAILVCCAKCACPDTSRITV